MAWLARVLAPLRRPWAALAVSAILSFVSLAALNAPAPPAEARTQAQANAHKARARRGKAPATLKAKFGRPTFLPSPTSNPPTAAKIALGQRLFFDKEISASGTIACASCHDPKLALSDGEATGRGVSGRRLVRHTPALWNLAWSRMLFWDGRAPSLEAQVRFPVEHPDEMGDSLENAVSRLSRHDSYQSAFAAAFPADPEINPRNLALALAAYERTLVSPPTRFDAWIAGDGSALTAAEIRGFEIFTGKGRCSNCHTGFALSDNNFYDIGLPGEDLGRGAAIALPAADHAFKTPTLRELAWTAPYMHDGSLPTLEDVVRHYEKGGVARPTRSGDLPRHLRLSDAERADLIVFLETLSSDQPPRPSQEPWVGTGEPAAMPAPADTRRISQADKKFAPAHVRVKAGETLTVFNDDTRTHNVRIFDPRFDFNSGAQEPREAVSIRFPVTGTFEAFCAIHPSMRLTVEVE
jgi:cytochrome c peroxidase